MKFFQSLTKTVGKRTVDQQASPPDLPGEEIQRDKQAQGRKKPRPEIMVSCPDDQRAALDLKDEEINKLKNQVCQQGMEIQRLEKIIESDKKMISRQEEIISRQAEIIRSAHDAYNDLRRAFTAVGHCFITYLNDEMPKRKVPKEPREEGILGAAPSFRTGGP